MPDKAPGSENGELTLSVLITRRIIWNTRRSFAGNSVGAICLFSPGGGAVLGVLGLVGLFFGEAVSLAPSVAMGLLLVGIFLIGYDGFFAPFLDRGAAAREFDEKPELSLAGTYRFTGTGVEIRNGSIEGTLPRGQMTSAAETESLFSLSFGREVRILIPKRLLGEEETRRLRNWIAAEKKGEPHG